MEECQVMCIATALRVQEGLRNHCLFLNERHSMKEAMARKKAFENSYATVPPKETGKENKTKSLN